MDGSDTAGVMGDLPEEGEADVDEEVGAAASNHEDADGGHCRVGDVRDAMMMWRALRQGGERERERTEDGDDDNQQGGDGVGAWHDYDFIAVGCGWLEKSIV